jgi:serine/threonine protein phosphatase PrpC
VDEANNRGGDDNITVLIIWVEPGPTKWQRFWKFMNEPRVFGKNRN